jgi:hypothetical protein
VASLTLADAQKPTQQKEEEKESASTTKSGDTVQSLQPTHTQHQVKEFYAVIDDDKHLKQHEHDIN